MDASTFAECCIVMHNTDDWSFRSLDKTGRRTQGDVANQVVANANDVDLPEGVSLRDKDIVASKSTVTTTVN
jgi:hypothetical protein